MGGGGASEESAARSTRCGGAFSREATACSSRSIRAARPGSEADGAPVDSSFEHSRSRAISSSSRLEDTRPSRAAQSCKTVRACKIPLRA